MTTFTTILLLLGTSLGFPYSSQEGYLAPHRALVIHTSREFYNNKGALESTDAGYFLVNLDRNSPRVLRDWVPGLSSAREISQADCEKRLYCGVPVYYPAASLLRINHWIPAPQPNLYNPISLEMLHMESPSVNRRKVKMSSWPSYYIG